MSSNKNLQLKSMYQENDVVTRWKTLKLGDLCRSISETYRNNDSEVILVNTSDVLNGKILNHKKVENKNLKGQFKKTFKKGDILYSEIRPANRRYAYIDFDETDQYIASTKLMVIRPDKSKIVPKFLVTYLSSERVLSELQQLAETRSGTFPQITFNSELAPMPICVPNIEYQKKILSILQPLNDKIELNNAINENLEKQAEAIFKSWFVDFEPFGGAKPSSWIVESLGNVCHCSLGGTPSRSNPEYWNGDIPWINSGEVNNFRIIRPSEYITKLGLNKSATKLLSAKTTVIAITGATLGQVSLLEIDTCTNQSVVGVTPSNQLPYEFVYPYIKSNIEKLISHQTGGAQQHINKQNVESLSVIIPPSDIIKCYTNLVKDLYSSISVNCFENEKLVKLRDALLPKLMSGEIDVSNVNI